MQFLSLALSLASNYQIDEAQAQRIATMHYNLNQFRNDDYKQFLKLLERYDDAQKLARDLNAYLEEHHAVNARMNQKIHIKWKNQLKRINVTDGHCPISLTTANRNDYELKFATRAAHFLYLLILLFAQKDMRLNMQSLENNDTLKQLANHVYGDGEHVINSLFGDSQDIFRKLRSFLGSTGINEEERFWFLPQQDSDGNFSMPLPFSSITIEYKEVFIKLSSEVIMNYQNPDGNNDIEKTLNAVIKKLSYGQTQDITPQHIGQNAWNYDIIRLLQEQASYNDTAKNLLAQAEIKSLDADSINAFDQCKQSAEKDNEQAMFLYAIYFLLVKHVQQDLTKAVEWLEKAEAKNHADATWLLGRCNFFGLGVAEDKCKAFELYKLAADLGSTGAARDAAYCLMKGIGTNRDVCKAYDYLRNVAVYGDMKASLFCEELLGNDWKRPLPEERIVDMVQKLEEERWQQLLNHNFNIENKKAELERLFQRIGKNGEEINNLLDLLDRFHYIPGEEHWIEHVIQAMQSQVEQQERTIKVERCTGDNKCNYQVDFGQGKILKGQDCKPHSLVVYIVVAALSANNGFTRSYVGKCKEDFAKLWNLLEPNCNNNNMVERYLESKGANGEDNGYLSKYIGHINKTIKRKIKEWKLNPDEEFFTIREHSVRGETARGTVSYRRLPANTHVNLPDEIQRIVDEINSKL